MELSAQPLARAGYSHIFGVLGDYNLVLMQQLEDRGQPAWIGNCNQPNAGCATDAYARINGLGAMIVTRVNGEFSTPRRQNQPIDPSNGILSGESRLSFDYLGDDTTEVRFFSFDKSASDLRFEWLAVEGSQKSGSWEHARCMHRRCR